MIELSPTIPDTIEGQLSETQKSPENQKFIALLKHYYDWLIQKGQPTDFIHNILQYRDIDLTNDGFRQHLASSLYSVIPVYANADKVLMTKHITEFLRSKGSFESFEFIMNAIYGETIQIEWNSDKLFRPSANESSRRASVVIESQNPWTNVETSSVVQTFPSPASATIESCITTTHNGKTLNWLTLNDKSVVGSFEVGGVVESLHNDVDRSKHHETIYYEPLSLANSLLEFYAPVEQASRPYTNLIVKQLGSDFRAVVESFVSRKDSEYYPIVTLKITSVTGTFIPTNELYIFASSLEGLIYTKEDFETGTVSKSIVDLMLNNKGSLYTSGDVVKFIGGNGLNADANIIETDVGGITAVDIINKGYGYAVGDKLVTFDAGTGSGFDAEVSAVDGIGASIGLISEVNTVAITNGGSGYAVNDELEIEGGVLKAGTPPARVIVTSVNSTWLFKGASVTNSGFGYPKYSKVELINTSTLAKIAGFSATPTFNAGNGISDLTINTVPTISTANLAIIVNGYGASYTANFSSGAIASFNQVNVGVNYVDPIVEIVGNGSNASATAVVSNGTVTGLIVTSPGTGYTNATVTIKERAGSGFSATPIIQNQTAGTGTITGLSFVSRGQYVSLPSCFSNVVVTKVGSGSGAKLSLDFRLLNATVNDAGNFYHSISTQTHGSGEGFSYYADLKDGVVASVRKVSGGSGYTYADVFISGGVGFIGRANIVGNSVDSIIITDGGYNYTAGNIVSIVGDGAGASFDLTGVNNLSDGVLKSFSVLNGGINYYHGTTITAPVTAVGAIPATLTPTIVNGSIVSVSSNGGSGYLQSDLANIVVSKGTTPVVTATISGTGKIVSHTTLNGGEGYWSQSEVTPLVISASIGTGAKFIPQVNKQGEITSVSVLDSGSGYTTSTVISVAGSGSNASLKAVVYQGRITDVKVINTGTGYKLGTSAIILGNGFNASVTPVVETGLTSVEVVNGGTGYTASTIVTVTDPTGTGAEVRPTVVNGKITSLTIINKGSGYTNPTLSASTGVDCVLLAHAKRNIRELTIDNAGTGYTYADVMIVGDGFNADFSLTFDKLGSIDTATITNTGTGITSTPYVVISDASGYGSVSAVVIKNNGGGFKVPPVLRLADKYDGLGGLIATGAKFVCSGPNIGAIKTIGFINNGASYDETPTPIFPLVAILAESAAFKVGEIVTIKGGSYKDVTSTNNILQTSGFKILLEDGSTLVQNINDASKEAGVTGKVIGYDYDRNMIKLDVSSDSFFISTEDDSIIQTEDGMDILDQMSSSFNIGDVIVGEKSKAHATIKFLNTASGIVKIGGNGWGKYDYSSSVGKLNSSSSVIPDNNRYQDHAYVVKAGRALKDYERLLKATVHPAGFSLFGDVVAQSMVTSGILNEIGYNRLIAMLYIVSVFAQYQTQLVGQEWSTLDSMVGDFTKFNTRQEIGKYKDYLIPQVSEIVYRTYTDYQSTVVANPLLETWSYSVTLTHNTSEGPLGDMAMHRIADTSSTFYRDIRKDLTDITIGNIVSIELYIKKQVAPTTYPMIRVSGSGTYNEGEFAFNTETGAIYNNTSNCGEIYSVGDFWFVRVALAATTTNPFVQIYPAVGFIGSSWNINGVGSIEITEPIVKTRAPNAVSNIGYIRAKNSQYANDMVHILNTETQVTIE